MHARSLLDYLPDTARAERGAGSLRNDQARSLTERLADLEHRLGDLLVEAQTPVAGPKDRLNLGEEISAILKRRGVQPAPRRPAPPPPLAARDWIDRAPPLAPDLGVEAHPLADPNLMKFIEAVRLLGRAADRFADRAAELPPQFAQMRVRDERRSAPAPQRVSVEPYGQMEPAPLRVTPRSRPTHPTAQADADVFMLQAELQRLRQELDALSRRSNFY